MDPTKVASTQHAADTCLGICTCLDICLECVKRHDFTEHDKNADDDGDDDTGTQTIIIFRRATCTQRQAE